MLPMLFQKSKSFRPSSIRSSTKTVLYFQVLATLVTDISAQNSVPWHRSDVRYSIMLHVFAFIHTEKKHKNRQFNGQKKHQWILKTRKNSWPDFFYSLFFYLLSFFFLTLNFNLRNLRIYLSNDDEIFFMFHLNALLKKTTTKQHKKITIGLMRNLAC